MLEDDGGGILLCQEREAPALSPVPSLCIIMMIVIIIVTDSLVMIMFHCAGGNKFIFFLHGQNILLGEAESGYRNSLRLTVHYKVIHFNFLGEPMMHAKV
jgi:hypothetical protein